MSNLDGPDAPYPGMAAAFEAHTGQSWTDPDWRQETAMWAAAWKAAKARPAGYCTEGDRCVCGGDTPAVRAGCANWVTPNMIYTHVLNKGGRGVVSPLDRVAS